MILVDTSVWVDYFNGNDTPQTVAFDRLLGAELILTGDLILAETLQGFRSDRDYETVRDLLAALECRTLGGYEIAMAAAKNYRALRAKGITVRKTIDMIIGTYCMNHGLTVLHADRDFTPLEQQLGLKVYGGDQTE